MFLITGGHRTLLKTDISPHGVCPSCGEKGTVGNSVWGMYFHVFWIPTFPIGKTGLAMCLNCEHTIPVKEMPHAIERDYRLLKSQTTVSIWYFSGSIVLTILIALAINWFNSYDLITD